VLFESIDLYAGHLQGLLAAGMLGDLGSVTLHQGRAWEGETAVRMVLGEYDHLNGVLDRGQWVHPARWRHLHAQLEQLYQTVKADPRYWQARRATGHGSHLCVLEGASALSA
jgi:hypothetical protein